MEIAARVDRLEDALIQLADAQQRTEIRLAELADVQRALVTAQERTETRLQALASAQERTEVRLGALATAQERTEAQLAALAAAQQRTETQLGTLLTWQQGEAGRRDGERLERDVVRGALTLFAGGEGGTPEQPRVQRWLSPLLVPLLRGGTVDLSPEADPVRADLLWRKGETLAVVEVSKVVDEHDVQRAHRRAETLRRAGAEVVAVVIGDSWASAEIRYQADVVYRMAWKVGFEVSDAYIAFRRLPA